MPKVLTKLEICDLLQDLLAATPEVHDIYVADGAIRVDLKSKDQRARERIATSIAALGPGATIAPGRPADVKNFYGTTILVKPRKGATASGASIYYGALEDVDLSEFDMSAFAAVSDFMKQGKLPPNIKEASDVLCVSSLNEAIVGAGATIRKGILIKVGPYRFENVIGCVPVTNGEPKADVVLVCRDGKKLYPDCYISYKMGTKVSDFQNLSGVSSKASPYIFNHKETLQFFKLLQALSKNKKNEITEPFILVKDNTIKAHAIWGMDYQRGSNFGINNCHMIAQGIPTIRSNTLSFSHEILNGDLSVLKGEQSVVFGARTANGRGAQGPAGITITGFRIGIFFRAYRNGWLKGQPTL